MAADILRFLYPAKCIVCHRLLDHVTELGMCSRCRKEVVLIEEPRCKRCSKPLFDEEAELCEDCSGRKFCVERGFALFQYGKEMQRAIRNFKYEGELAGGNFFAEELIRVYGTWINHISPEVIIPIPIHKNRRRFRGFNQAEYVAGIVGERLGIPVSTEYLLRREDTAPQKSLGVTERVSNLQKGFAVREDADTYQTVLLIDDIYTTGATLEACGMTLKAIGTEKIYFLCICIGTQ